MSSVMLTVLILTWNVSQEPPPDLSSVPDHPLFLTVSSSLPDLYVIGLQGMKVDGNDWDKALNQIMTQYQYMKVGSERLQGSGIMVQVYMQQKHSGNIKLGGTASASTGTLGYTYSYKGASSVSLTLYGVTACFVNSLLAPDTGTSLWVSEEKRDEQRTAEINRIFTGTHFQTRPFVIVDHNLLFWFGDLDLSLNKKMKTPITTVISSMKQFGYRSLLEYDDMKRLIPSAPPSFDRSVFKGMREAAINFPPTFKYVKGTKNYSLETKLGWTDRILYKVDNAKIKVVSKKYNSLEDIVISDHRPVIGVYEVTINT